MKAKSTILALAAVMLLGACTPESPPIDSLAFARRPPAPGQPSYLETIKYIDDGVKYIDPLSEFFVSYDGEMCFRGLINHQQAEFETYRSYWCMHPLTVNNIDALENDVSYVNEVRLWCMHADPQCAHRVGFPDFLDTSPGIANRISVQIVPFQQERRALEYLVYLMGGNVRGTEPTGPFGKSASLR